MADVFISYARADEGFVERLAPAIEALGLTVWWDRHLKPGDDFQIAIEAELDAAKAVVAVWSAASVKSRAVRAEAEEAAKEGKLAPVRIAQVKPPLFSRGIHFEDFAGWSGETSTVEFQDLAAQLYALAKGQEAASHTPRDGVTAPSAAIAYEEDAPILNLPWLNRPIGPFKSGAGLIGFLLAIGGALALFVNREELLGPYWEAIAVLALLAIALFNAAESSLRPNVKAMVARWLQPAPGAKPLRSSVAFLAMFEAVFTKRHWSLRCFAASAVASILFYVGLLLLLVPAEILQRNIARLIENGVEPPEPVSPFGVDYVSTTLLEHNAALLFIAIPIANIVVDYLSLWETRWILRWAARSLPTPIAAILDAVLTGAVFVAFLPLGPVAFSLGMAVVGSGVDDAAVANAWALAIEIWRSLYVFVTVGWPGELLSAVAGEANVTNTTLLIAFVTTFMTSAWLWAAVVFAPVVRLLSWGRRRGLSLIGLALNTRARPIAPMGYVSAALILAIGALASATAQALQEAGLATVAEEGELFKDCAICPEMVVLPGGTFTMGSPEDEEGRFDAEGPQRDVTIAPFAIGRYEVTFREWDACVAETADLPKAERCRAIPRYGELIDGDQGWGRGLRPVITVSWNDAQAYLRWLNAKVEGDGVVYRLPSEAEWEYAARAGTTTPYSFGDDAELGCRFMNSGDASGARLNPMWADVFLKCDDSYPFTAPIGSYEANAFGLHDMHGSVWEWTEDCWHGGYENAPVDGAAWMGDDDGDCSLAVIRGGSWDVRPRSLRSASRDGDLLDTRYDSVGFRVARTVNR